MMSSDASLLKDSDTIFNIHCSPVYLLRLTLNVGWLLLPFKGFWIFTSIYSVKLE